MTINIVKTWANIGDNYLDSSLEYTKDISQKVSLEHALQKTITLLHADIQDPTDILPAIYEMKRRVKFPGGSLPVLMALNTLLNNIATKLLNNYSYRELKKYLVPDSCQKDIYYNLLSKLREENYKQLVDSKNNNRGVIYKIENKKECTSYLIGTVHHSASLLGGTKIPELVQNSSEFFSEMGELVFESTRDIMDDVLTRIASANKIPIYALETPEELSDIDTKVVKEYSALSKERIEKKKELKLKKLKEKGDLEKYNEFCEDEFLFRFDNLTHWKKGDVESLKRNYKIASSLASLNTEAQITFQGAKHRNQHWLRNKNLLSKLVSTEKPVSIAVGVFHLFGKRGLIKDFEGEGLKVTQI